MSPSASAPSAAPPCGPEPPAPQRATPAAAYGRRAAHLWAEGRRGDWAQAHVHESSWRTWKLEPRLPGLVPLVVSLPNHDAWQAPISPPAAGSVWTSGQSRAASCSWLLDKIGLQNARHDFRPPRRAMQEKYSASPPCGPEPACPESGPPSRGFRRTGTAGRPSGGGPSPAHPPKKREKNRARWTPTRRGGHPAPCKTTSGPVESSFSTVLAWRFSEALLRLPMPRLRHSGLSGRAAFLDWLVIGEGQTLQFSGDIREGL